MPIQPEVAQGFKVDLQRELRTVKNTGHILSL